MTKIAHAGILLVTTAFLLSACEAEQKHASLAGTPDKWWSDNYYAMLQTDDMGDSPATPAMHKPVRIKLP